MKKTAMEESNGKLILAVVLGSRGEYGLTKMPLEESNGKLICKDLWIPYGYRAICVFSTLCIISE